MKDFDKCIEEIKTRGNKKIQARRKRLACSAACFTALCICTTAAFAIPRDNKVAHTLPIVGVTEGNESHINSNASEGNESPINSNAPEENESHVNSSVVDCVESKEPDRIVITASAVDNYGGETESLPSISEKYISPTLEEQFKKQNPDVFYRTIVEILFTAEDGEGVGKLPKLESSDKASELLAKYEAAEAELKALLEERSRGMTIDNADEQREKYKDKINELYEKRDELYELYRDQCTKDKNNYLKPIYDARLEYAYSIGAENVIPLASSSDCYPCMGAPENSYIMELTAEMINKMAERGGYAFRLAPPERASGYDVKVSDSLTVMLDKADENSEFHVAVVLVAYEYNDFAMIRGIGTNPYYNSQLIKPLEEVFPSINFKAFYGDADYMPWEERTELFAKYQNDVVWRNGLTEKRIFRGNEYPCDVSEYAFGFEAKLTKAEILSLTEDEDVRVIYSMDLVNSDYIPGSENE